MDLARSYAYGNSVNDRWMLAAVGRPTAVNAGEELRRVARLYGWPEVQWKEKSRGALGERRTVGKNEADSEKMNRTNAESLG